MLARAGLVMLVALAAPFAACSGDGGQQRRVEAERRRGPRGQGGTVRVMRPEVRLRGRAARAARRAGRLPARGGLHLRRGRPRGAALAVLQRDRRLLPEPRRREPGRGPDRVVFGGPVDRAEGLRRRAHYTDDPGTPKRTMAEGVVNDCLRR